MTSVKKINLRQFNHILSVVVIMLAVYILLLPLLPQFGFWFNKTLNTGTAPLVSANQTENPNNTESRPEDDTLVIPSINLQQQIFDGPSSGVLNKGVWHRPNTSTPNQKGNTVIVGHRFTYTNPNGEFYHLDKVRVGDKIVVYWQGAKYVYTVEKSYVTHADDSNVEQPSQDDILTLYTCTPLWSAKDRLVIQSILEKVIE